MLKVGIVLLLLSMETFLLAVRNYRTYNWVPSTTPLILKKDQPTRLSFVADGDFTYNIQLDFQLKIEYDQLNIDLWNMQNDAVFAIQVEEDGKPIETASGARSSYGTLSLIPGSIDTHSSRHYNVTITPKKSFPELQLTNPQAKVCVDTATYVNYVLRMLVSTLLPISIFLVGLGTALAGWWRSRSARK